MRSSIFLKRTVLLILGLAFFCLTVFKVININIKIPISVLIIFIIYIFEDTIRIWDRYAPDIIIAVISTLISFPATVVFKIDEWWALVFGVIIGILYDQHNQILLRRWKEKTDETIKMWGGIQNPISKIIIDFPEYNKLGMELQESKNKYDSRIINHVLSDQQSLLKKGEHIITLEKYLEMLAEFGDSYNKLYCVNQTLPIYWFSPNPIHKKFVIDYAKRIKHQNNLNIRRLTIVENRDELKSQFEQAYDWIKKRWTDDILIDWGLVLFQQLWDRSNPGLITEIEERFLDYEFRNVIRSILIDNSESIRVESGILEKCKDEHMKELKRTYEEFRNSEGHRKTINMQIIKKYSADNKKDGSFYLNQTKLQSEFSENIKEYGEFGVYLNNGNPDLAFATIGEFGSIIRIKSWFPSNMLKSLSKLFEEAGKVKADPDLGNMIYLYEP